MRPLWLAGRRRWLALRTALRRLGARTTVRWRVVLGAGCGAVLALLVFLALASQRPTAAPAAHSSLHRLPGLLRDAVTHYRANTYTDQTADLLADATTKLLVRDSSRHRLTLTELLRFRQQALDQNAHLYRGLNYLRHLNQLLTADSTQRGTYNDRKCANLQRELLEAQSASLVVLDSTQRLLAEMQLRYLQQPEQAGVALAPLRRALAQLQFDDAQPPPGGAPEPVFSGQPTRVRPSWQLTPPLTKLTQRKLALASTLELLQSDTEAGHKAATRRLLDSCQREVRQLRWLDSCRVQQHWQWYAATGQFAAPLNTLFSTGFYVVLAALLLLLLLPPALAWLGWRQARHQLGAKGKSPVQQLEPPLLQVLLLAYAPHLRLLLHTPRQIKRFAGKVRLQYHLLEALAGQTSSFTFGPAEQVLAFVLLLVLEENPQGSARPYQDAASFVQHLRDAYQQAQLEGRLNAALSQQFAFQYGRVQWWAEAGGAGRATHHVFSLAFAEARQPDANQAELLRQLYWLNTGLLV